MSNVWLIDLTQCLILSHELRLHTTAISGRRAPRDEGTLYFPIRPSPCKVEEYVKPATIRQGSPVAEDSILFAVKTWTGFHETRARVVKKTWGRHVTHLMFFSDRAGEFFYSLSESLGSTHDCDLDYSFSLCTYLLFKLFNPQKVCWKKSLIRNKLAFAFALFFGVS